MFFLRRMQRRRCKEEAASEREAWIPLFVLVCLALLYPWMDRFWEMSPWCLLSRGRYANLNTL